MMRRTQITTATGLLGALLYAGSRPAAQSTTQAPASPTFEVATVKANKSGEPFIRIGGGPGRYAATNVPLRVLIQNAYRIQNYQLVGAPGWIDSERFDIVAKPDANATPDQNPLMLRALLAERFKLKVHNETREMPVYALMLARNDGKLGPKLTTSAIDCAALAAAARGRGPGGPAPPPPSQPGERPRCGMMIGPGRLSMGGQPLSQFATSLSNFAGRIVQDRTGLSGPYDLELTWTPEQLPQGGGATPPPGAPAFPLVDPNGPSIFTAVQEQLGLKLDSTRGPVDVVVVDSVERPTDD
jgi:uncharacterized protein (TIGR03435 family)